MVIKKYSHKPYIVQAILMIMEEKERRIRAITQMYYSNPKVQEYLASFSKEREVVPRYFEGFGKRPDTLHYPSDVMGLVLKGATSFHASEELWKDPLQLNSEMTQEEMNDLRKGWDLLIDIDSPFLDCSRIAAKLIIAALEHHGVKNFGLKFSGSKGFHLIISGESFPARYGDFETCKMFPSWPRAISEYLMHFIRSDYNRQASEILTNFAAIEKRTKVSKDELMEVYCKICDRPAKKGAIIALKCPVCGLEMNRRDIKLTKRRLRCLNSDCAGVLENGESKEYHFCEYCKDDEGKNLNSQNNPESFDKSKSVSAAKVAALDLVLVAPRHLFRMPYSLHEKTALASVVMNKEDLAVFSPRDADPLRIQLRPFIKHGKEGEATQLLVNALAWKKTREKDDEELEKGKRKEYKSEDLIELTGVSEEMFPAPIKKLFKGLHDGKKRGLFVIITFLRACGFPNDVIETKIRDWNKLNQPPLKEGYIKSQIDWHFRQKKKILPPNYENPSFYKDLGLIDKKPDVKNPLVEVMRAVRKRAR
ncbi:hypothetical protein FJZ18_03180 [Candidatus Pacearchaeota archaeon]|nr:hypothetical protein [Candidatus Pacearchaeota archaeon]